MKYSKERLFNLENIHKEDMFIRNTIFRRYRFIPYHDVDDVVQDTYLYLFKKFENSINSSCIHYAIKTAVNLWRCRTCKTVSGEELTQYLCVESEHKDSNTLKQLIKYRKFLEGEKLFVYSKLVDGVPSKEIAKLMNTTKQNISRIKKNIVTDLYNNLKAKKSPDDTS